MEKENTTAPVGQSENSGGIADASDKQPSEKNTVDYDSFVKVLDEKKRAQSAYNEALTELEKFREADLKRKGKTDELLSAKDKRIAELESMIENKDKTYTWKTITDNIKTEAIKNGCTQPDKLIRLMSDDDLKKLSENLGSDFSIDGGALNEIIEKNKKENFFLFQETQKISANGKPKFNAPDDSVDFSKLSLDELKEMHRKLSVQK